MGARRAHCAYRRGGRLRRPLNGAPSALLHGAPSARWSYPAIRSTLNRVGWRVDWGQKCDHIRQKSASNMQPVKQKSVGEHVGGSNMRPLMQNVRQKRDPFVRKSTPNAVPKSSGTPPLGWNKTRFCHFRRVFSCIWRPAGSDPQAGRGRGEVNLSPKEHLTLRPRVGGFEVGPIWTHVGVLVTESPQSLGSPHAGCLLSRE